MVSESFNKDYTKYWKEAVNKSIDGTVIADKSIAKIFLDKINLRRDITSLDLGCSYGRMYDLLNLYSSEVHGVDVDKYAIKEAKKYNYKSLQVSSTTKINYSNESFQLIFCWAVFEVLDHAKTLIEMNRLLSEGGHVVLTAKNDCYYNDDLLAFTNDYLFPDCFCSYFDGVSKSCNPETCFLCSKQTSFYECEAELTLLKTLEITTLIMVLVCASNFFGAVFSRLGTPTMITEFLMLLDLPPTAILLIIMALIFLLAWPLEWVPIVLIIIPIVLPLIEQLGFNLTWFGILVAVNLQTAWLSPPVALSAYFLKGVVPEWDLSDIYKGMMQFMVIQVIGLALIILFPQIVLWLPTYLYG